MTDTASSASASSSVAAAAPAGSSLAGGLGRLTGPLYRVLGQTDVALALGLVAILVVLILPMPRWLLDISLAISITLSVLILMTSILISRPLDFSSFPTVLLIATMLRLALNLASTRLILSHGHEGTAAAGHVIQAFGNFVMSGNFLIGIIVFSILVIVNFVVITKGSGRIAEVSARFSLDSMPGKQMAIDADLSAGLIDEAGARKRRKILEDESTFFGSMDGAAKFVRGDAVAGLLITFINIVGGIIIGVAQNGLSFAQATHTYTLLTVGDGLVSQIPALIVSTAAGLIVSKSGAVGSADKELFGQLGGYPKALGMSSFLTGCLALLPGVPMLPFLLLAGTTGGAAWLLVRRREEAAEKKTKEEASKAAGLAAEEPISTALKLDNIRIELGYGLIPLINNSSGHRLTDQIKALRRQLASEMGFVLPAVRIQDNMQLGANGYVVRVKEVEVGRGELKPGMLLVMDPRGDKIALPGEETAEPTFGLPAMWVAEGYREEAMFKGYTVVDPPTVLTTHLTEAVKSYMAELLSYSETQKLLDELDKEQHKLVSDIIPAQINVGAVQRVLQNLLHERISIRDLSTILEGIAEVSAHTRNVSAITEHVRSRLARQISEQAMGENGYIPLVTLSPEWEQSFAEALTGQGEERQLAMAPSRLQQFIAGVRQTLERFAMLGETAVLLTSPPIRPFVRSIMDRVRPLTMVMSQNEVHPKARIKTLGQV